VKLVSVIIPIYQVENYIEEAVYSVINQTYKHIEIIIVDDGSTDKSREICQQFQDPRIKIITQENQGVSAARNKGIRQAQGEFLAFLDGDDRWLPQKIELHVKYLEAFSDVGMSFDGFTYMDEFGKSLEVSRLYQLEKITLELILCRNPVGNSSCVVIKRKLLEEIKVSHKSFNNIGEQDCYFDEDLNHFEDVELWLRVALESRWKIQVIPNILTWYRVSPRGASANFERQIKELDKALEKISLYAPELTQKYGKVVKAYTFRKGAQQAVRQRKVADAIAKMRKALSTHWQIILEDPIRTSLLLGAIVLLYSLPRSHFERVEMAILKLLGTFQKYSSDRLKN
jgi:glycosyltransferase involved in cell wall biosynthesis